MMYRAIFDLYDIEGVELDHLCDGPNWKHTCAGKCVDCQWENPLTKPMAEEAVKLAQQIWKEVVLEAGDRLPEPGGSAGPTRKRRPRERSPRVAPRTSQVTPQGAQKGQVVTLMRAPNKAWTSASRRARTLSAGIFAAA